MSIEALKALNIDGSATQETSISDDNWFELERMHDDGSDLIERLSYRDHTAWRLTCAGQYLLASARSWRDLKEAA